MCHINAVPLVVIAAIAADGQRRYLLSSPIEHEDTQRLRKRIIRHNQELFIFLDDPSVEPTNNRAERQLRPMVIMRKLTFGNRSDLGASNQAGQ